VYEEALEKVFDNPIKLDVLAGQPERGQEVSGWSLEDTTTLAVHIQTRDAKDKGVEPTPGDVFLYGDELYEILNVVEVGDMFGQAEYGIYYKLTSGLIRSGRVDFEAFRKLLIEDGDFQASSIQKTFEQQRGLPETPENGVTGDRRAIRRRLRDDMADPALGEGPRKVSSDEDPEDVSDTDGKQSSSSFYNE